MGISKKKAASTASGQQKIRGSVLNVWHAVFFAAGVVLTGVTVLLVGLLQRGVADAPFVRGAAQHAAHTDGVKAKPWGELEITPMVLDRPDEFFDKKDAPAPAIRWHFPGFTRQQVTDFLRSCDLTAAQQATLLETNRWEPARNGCYLRPPLEVVQELSPGAREKLYLLLGASRENPFQSMPFTFRAEGFDDLFAGCDLPPEKIALAKKLSFRRGELLYFADGQLFELISSPNETRCLFKALCRVPTLMMKLHLNADSDIKALLRYWGAAGRGAQFEPLLRSLARVPGGAYLNISYFMPPVPRLRLYTYPRPTDDRREDCFWTGFNFFNERPDYRLGDAGYAQNILQAEYNRVEGEKRFGDLMMLVEQGEQALHMCVYVADDIVFTKNGGDYNQPWVLMRLHDMLAQYTSPIPKQWRIYRKLST